MLEQHRNAAQPALAQRARERAGHHHVARRIDLAEQTGVTFDRAVVLDPRLRTEELRRILGRSEHDSSFTLPWRGRVDANEVSVGVGWRMLDGALRPVRFVTPPCRSLTRSATLP